eukprot:3952059-Pleurochrysis_carterae.AAC.1
MVSKLHATKHARYPLGPMHSCSSTERCAFDGPQTRLSLSRFAGADPQGPKRAGHRAPREHAHPGAGHSQARRAASAAGHRHRRRRR